VGTVLTYIVLAKYTDQGMRTVRQGPQRREALRQRIEQLGGRLVSRYTTQGQYDLVLLLEFPDETAATVFLLELGEQGNHRTETLRAFTAEEMDRVWPRMAGR
jgi:uncharacterized protein with GYD domain